VAAVEREVAAETVAALGTAAVGIVVAETVDDRTAVQTVVETAAAVEMAAAAEMAAVGIAAAETEKSHCQKEFVVVDQPRVSCVQMKPEIDKTI
jgi:hypothetical protein